MSAPMMRNRRDVAVRAAGAQCVRACTGHGVQSGRVRQEHGSRPAGLAQMVRHLFIAVALLLLPGCFEGRLPEGVVATINGEPIHLHAVQALMDSRSAALGIPHAPSLEQMKSRYGGALRTLIVHALVRQDLDRRGLGVTDAALEHAVDQVRQDFGPDGLEQFLTASSLPEADWKALMRDYLAMETFKKRVLRPGIRISQDEARAYYAAHTADFTLPDHLDACFASAPDKETLGAYCTSFAARVEEDSRVAADIKAQAEASTEVRTAEADSPVHATLWDRPDESVQCLGVRPDEIPQPWRKEVAALKPGTCGTLRVQDGEWRTVALAARRKGRVLSLAEAYPLIEHILLSEKKGIAFQQWLEDNIARSDIRVAHELHAPLLAPEALYWGDSNGDEGDDLEREDPLPEDMPGATDPAPAGVRQQPARAPR